MANKYMCDTCGTVKDGRLKLSNFPSLEGIVDGKHYTLYLGDKDYCSPKCFIKDMKARIKTYAAKY